MAKESTAVIELDQPGSPDSAGTTRVPAIDRRDPPKPPVEIETAADPQRGERQILRRSARPRRSVEEDTEASRRALADSANRTAAAEKAAADARNETSLAVTTLVSERVTGAQRLLDNAKGAKISAQGKLRAAREGGDFEAEQAAIDEISRANYDIGESEKALARAKIDHENLAKPVLPAPGGTGEPKPSPISQRWIENHPLINTDKEYRAIAAAGDSLAVSEGHQRGSQSYVDFVDRYLEDEFGVGHGVPETHEWRGRRDAEVTSAHGAPRGGGGSRFASEDDRTIGGARQVETPFGRLGYRVGADGRPIITFPNASVRADFEEGARACNMSLAEYARDQVSIAQEIASGRNAGLFREEETAVMR